MGEMREGAVSVTAPFKDEGRLQGKSTERTELKLPFIVDSTFVP